MGSYLMVYVDEDYSEDVAEALNTIINENSFLSVDEAGFWGDGEFDINVALSTMENYNFDATQFVLFTDKNHLLAKISKDNGINIRFESYTYFNLTEENAAIMCLDYEEDSGVAKFESVILNKGKYQKEDWGFEID